MEVIWPVGFQPNARERVHASRRRPASADALYRESGRRTEALLKTQVAPAGNLQMNGCLPCLCCEHASAPSRRRPATAAVCDREGGQRAADLLRTQVAPPSDMRAAGMQCLCCDRKRYGKDFVASSRDSFTNIWLPAPPLSEPIFGCPSSHANSMGGGADDALHRTALKRETQVSTRPLPHHFSAGVADAFRTAPQRRPIPRASSCAGARRSSRRCGQREPCARPASEWSTPGLNVHIGRSPFR